MTDFAQRTGTGNRMLVTDYDVSKIFVWNNRYSHANMTNSTYDAITYPAGTVLGRISATREVTPMLSTATNGSKLPVGVLSETVTIDGGDTLDVPFCIGGDVAEPKLVFSGSDTINTVVDGRIYRDHLAGDTLGIKAVPSTDQTGLDN